MISIQSAARLRPAAESPRALLALAMAQKAQQTSRSARQIRNLLQPPYLSHPMIAFFAITMMIMRTIATARHEMITKILLCFWCSSAF